MQSVNHSIVDFCVSTVDQESYDEIHSPVPTVLLVEDDEFNRIMIGMYLDYLGLVHDTAVNGREAVTKFKVGSFDIVLMDVVMPEADGYMATREIRAYEAQTRNSPVCIIGITALAFEEDHELCISAGMNDCLVKPFSPEMLESRMLKAA